MDDTEADRLAICAGRVRLLEAALRAAIQFAHPISRCVCRGCCDTRALIEPERKVIAKTKG